jgi:hypothetical protein
MTQAEHLAKRQQQDDTETQTGNAVVSSFREVLLAVNRSQHEFAMIEWSLPKCNAAEKDCRLTSRAATAAGLQFGWFF